MSWYAPVMAITSAAQGAVRGPRGQFLLPFPEHGTAGSETPCVGGAGATERGPGPSKARRPERPARRRRTSGSGRDCTRRAEPAGILAALDALTGPGAAEAEAG
ncbi:hypothetical protein GCM10010389_53210 [Streptomyces echinoruber]|uniref:Uncharacterized protein n=1 Tax=Streptomyces echinoruber TaxID=68898 RepID=A0A918RSX9_9ACTN|nr:hypothetical protein GCM10010389_53210 [Streptomyces echinoruber]